MLRLLHSPCLAVFQCTNVCRSYSLDPFISRSGLGVIGHIIRYPRDMECWLERLDDPAIVSGLVQSLFVLLMRFPLGRAQEEPEPT